MLLRGCTVSSRLTLEENSAGVLCDSFHGLGLSAQGKP